MDASFEWDEDKNQENKDKHGVSFEDAQKVFADPDLLILADEKHSTGEDRFYAIGTTQAGIMTVRFTRRGGKIRIFGAGLWTKYRKRYLNR